MFLYIVTGCTQKTNSLSVFLIAKRRLFEHPALPFRPGTSLPFLPFFGKLLSGGSPALWLHFQALKIDPIPGPRERKEMPGSAEGP